MEVWWVKLKTHPFFRFFQTGTWRRARPFPAHLILALFFLTFTLGCSLLNPDTPDPAPEGQAAAQVTMVCSEECAKRGQCGQTADGRSVILGHPDRPVVSDHQMLFSADASLPMVGTRSQRVRVVTTGAEFDATFYLVTRPEDGRSGWVAGWCVVQ